MILQNCEILSRDGSWLKVKTKSGDIIEVNTIKKEITRLKLSQLMEIVNSI